MQIERWKLELSIMDFYFHFHACLGCLHLVIVEGMQMRLILINLADEDWV